MSDSTSWPDPEEVDATGADGREARRRLFSAYVDDALPDDVLASVEDRLDADPDFREALDAYETMVTAIRDLPRQGADSEFLDDVQDSLRRRSGGRFFGAPRGEAPNLAALNNRSRLHEVAAAAMLAVMLGAYVSFGPDTDELTTADSPRLDVPPKSAVHHQ